MQPPVVNTNPSHLTNLTVSTFTSPVAPSFHSTSTVFQAASISSIFSTSAILNIFIVFTSCSVFLLIYLDFIVLGTFQFVNSFTEIILEYSYSATQTPPASSSSFPRCLSLHLSCRTTSPCGRDRCRRLSY